MFEYGYGLQESAGTYLVAADGGIVAKFPDFEDGWPAMKLDAATEPLALRAADDAFIMGTRGGATIRASDQTFWPFRAIGGDKEAQVLKRIKRTE